MKVGIYQGMPFDEYNALPALRNSYLKKLEICGAYAQMADSDSKAFATGRAAHTLILEGHEEFLSQYVVLPSDAPAMPPSRSINAKKPSPETVYALQWWEMFNRQSSGRTPVSTEDYKMLAGMNEAVKSHPFATLLLSEGVSEQTVVFEIEVMGVSMLCKARPDRTPNTNMAVLIDLKSCEDASYRGFMSSCYRYGYFHQAAYYLDGYNLARESMIERGEWNEVDNPPMDAFAFVAVEKKFPYRTEVYTLTGDNSLLIEGREKYLENLATEATCRKKGFYPHYQNAGAQELLPFSERV